MASASDDDVFDRFLERRGHEPAESWDRSYNKKQCPECGGLHEPSAVQCSVCDWQGPNSGADVGAD